MKDILRNWKTSVAGIAALSLVAAFLMGRMTPNDLLAGLGVLLGGGLLAAKDGDKSGTSTGA